MSDQISFIDHALRMLHERGIEEDWVVRTLMAPERVVVDLRDASRLRAFRRIPEFGGRRLRVVYEKTQEGDRVITCFFDRKAEAHR